MWICKYQPLLGSLAFLADSMTQIKTVYLLVIKIFDDFPVAISL